MRHKLPKSTALTLLTLLLVVCGCGNAVRVGTAPSLVALTILPAQLSSAVGLGTQLTVRGLYSDGTSDIITGSLTWSVLSQDANLTPAGVLTCFQPGSAVVTVKIETLQATTTTSCEDPFPTVLTISPYPLIINVSSPTQLHLTGAFQNLPSQDLTAVASWAIQGEIASVTQSGVLICQTSGKDLVTATYDGVSTSENVDCSGSRLHGPLSLTLPGNRTPVGYTLSAVLSTSPEDGGADVTGLAEWSVSPADYASVVAGKIKCVKSGAVTISASYEYTSASALLTCAPTSFNAPFHYVEQSAEFAGPFTNWLNVKEIGAMGDGVTDDTQALQNGLSALIPDQSRIRVLYLPAGVYRITQELTVANASYINIVGADPNTTRIVWDGPGGGSMLNLNGMAVVRLTRLTFDGGGNASVAVDVGKTSAAGLYTTGMELSDLHLLGVQTGINLERAAETDVERVFFDHNTETGLHLGDPNNINIFIKDSLFSHCGTGISNYEGAGVFNVSSSVFDHSSVADMHIQNTGFFSARQNLSVGSASFFLSELIGANNAEITLQGNTVLDPLNTPVVLGNTGPLMMIDNVFRMLDATSPVLTAWDGRSPWDPVTQASAAFLFGNVYSSANAVGAFDGNVVSYDESVVDAASINTPIIPDVVYTPPNYGRLIFEVPAGSTDSVIQAAINAAAASNVIRPIVHLPQGGYSAYNPLIFPSGSDIQLVGDGLNISTIYWKGPASGAAIKLPNTRVKLSNFSLITFEYQYGDHVPPAPGALDGLLYTVDDQPADRVIASQLLLEQGNVQSFFSERLEHEATDLSATYMLGLVNGIGVTGGNFRSNGQATLGRTDFTSGSIQSTGTSTSLSVSENGRLLVQDNWHDFDATSPQNFVLSGSGTLTEQGGATYMNSSTPFVINDFSGDVTLMGLSVTGGFSLNTAGSETNLLTVGLAGIDSQFMPAETSVPATGNVIDGFYSGAYSQLASETPDVVWMRRMLGQVRSETPVPLGSGDASSEARLDRVEVQGMSNAVHVRANAQHSGLYTTIIGRKGTITATANTCLMESSDATTAAQWVLAPGGEGDFVLSLGGHPEQAATAFQDPEGNWQVTLAAADSGYQQHWNIQMGGSGQFQLINRGTGLALEENSATGGCLTLTSDLGSAETFWTVQAH